MGYTITSFDFSKPGSRRAKVSAMSMVWVLGSDSQVVKCNMTVVKRLNK